MFSNIGGKIKTLAKVICWVGIITSVISGICTIISGSMAGGDTLTILSGIVTIIVGSLSAWIGSFITYGFGDIVENVQKIAKK